MKLSTKGRYAVMALADLAIYDRMGPVSLRDVSLRQNISLMYLEQIFLKLKKNNIVKSMRGNKGGYKLSKNSNEIKLSEILLAVNEKLVANLDKIEKRVEKSNENTIGELQSITNTLINELSKNSKISVENNKKLSSDLAKLNRSNSKTISKAIQQISNKAIYKQIVANQAIQAQQISKLVKQNNNVLGKIADKTSRIKYP